MIASSSRVADIFGMLLEYEAKTPRDMAYEVMTKVLDIEEKQEEENIEHIMMQGPPQFLFLMRLLSQHDNDVYSKVITEFSSGNGMIWLGEFCDHIRPVMKQIRQEREEGFYNVEEEIIRLSHRLIMTLFSTNYEHRNARTDAAEICDQIFRLGEMVSTFRPDLLPVVSHLAELIVQEPDVLSFTVSNMAIASGEPYLHYIIHSDIESIEGEKYLNEFSAAIKELIHANS